MSLKSTIEADIKTAMLAKNKDELTALRAIKSAILLAETEKGASSSLEEAVEIQLLTKAAKQRKESAEIFKAQNREDLAEKELKELEVINRYLPQPMDTAALESALKQIIAEVGATGPGDMGKVMGIASKKFAGKADGKTISDVVKKLLAS